MKINMLEINSLGDGKFNIAFNGTNDKGSFGLVATYHPATKKLRIEAVCPRQPKKPFKAAVLESIAKEPPESFQ